MTGVRDRKKIMRRKGRARSRHFLDMIHVRYVCFSSMIRSIEKEFPQRYTPVRRLVTERIAYDGAQAEPEKQEPHANQGEERAEPKEELYHRKNVMENCQNQALDSFACDWRTPGRRESLV